jgi:hypothetical protein
MERFEIIYRLRQAGVPRPFLHDNLGVSQAVIGNVIHDRITAYSGQSVLPTGGDWNPGVVADSLTASNQEVRQPIGDSDQTHQKEIPPMP